MDAVDTPACFDAALICSTMATVIAQWLMQVIDIVSQLAHMWCYYILRFQVCWGSGLAGCSPESSSAGKEELSGEHPASAAVCWACAGLAREV